MQPVKFADIEIQGGLACRSVFNYARLEGKWYRPDEVFTADIAGWPGDWEGRIMLALTLLAQSTHRTPAYLAEIQSLVPEHLNQKGYFGAILPEGVYDEQQMAGNSWFLRSMIEYYYWKKDEAVKRSIETLVKNLILPARGHYAKYPLDPATRDNVPEWSLSKIQHKAGKHKETLDTGCAFIMLDGATQAYELLGWPELKNLIEEMTARYLEMDLAGLQAQTHATLSALRGVIRMYEIDGNREHLDIAKRIFAFYRETAWTESYGNYNWFNRPRWTEPCAIIDSFMLSVQLWKNTGDPAYLEDAHHIYYNALAHAQRTNGSLGTDICLGAGGVFLGPLTWEVYWCCTMRGGEGWSRAIEYSYFTDGNTLILPFYHDNTAVLHLESGSLKLKEKSGYPAGGRVDLEVLDSAMTAPCTLRFFAPSFMDRERAAVSLNGAPLKVKMYDGFIEASASLKKGDHIRLVLPPVFYTRGTMNKNNLQGYHTFRLGPMLLACNNSEEISLPCGTEFIALAAGKFQVKKTDTVLSPLSDIKNLTAEESTRQVLFKD
ncbi:MAG: beta-L-arabinofuranosidase domain-containing protein [Bacillota bacterium]